MIQPKIKSNIEFLRIKFTILNKIPIPRPTNKMVCQLLTSFCVFAPINAKIPNKAAEQTNNQIIEPKSNITKIVDIVTPFIME